MPKRKYKRPVYTSKNHKLDGQMEVTNVKRLLSASSLLELQNIQGKIQRHTDHVTSGRKK